MFKDKREDMKVQSISRLWVHSFIQEIFCDHSAFAKNYTIHETDTDIQI